ncbi:MAG: CHRD domain-containing protein [Allosphingosinicella sp.]|uniref:CHRD domain-containing protein n=1 Tax=Allosphingosinicella sp. TaxID=2823234 RepID=UPI00393EE6A6
MTVSRIGVTSLVLAVGAALAGCETVGDAVGEGLQAEMTGVQEVPGPGDPDGTGRAEVTIVDRTDNLCYVVTVANIEPATAAHIHRGARGVAGPPVVTLDAPADGESRGCLSVPSALADEIERSPASFYVNVHNARYPNGAVRGQLRR